MPPAELKLTDEIKALINRSLDNNAPIALSYVDAAGKRAWNHQPFGVASNQVIGRRRQPSRARHEVDVDPGVDGNAARVRYSHGSGRNAPKAFCKRESGQSFCQKVCLRMLLDNFLFGSKMSSMLSVESRRQSDRREAADPAHRSMNYLNPARRL